MTRIVRFPFRIIVGSIFEDGDPVPLEYRAPPQASSPIKAQAAEPAKPDRAISEDSRNTFNGE